MAQKTLAELVTEIVAAYDAFTNIEISNPPNKPSLLEAARGALSDRIYEAREMLKGVPKAQEMSFAISPNKSRGTDRRR